MKEIETNLIEELAKEYSLEILKVTGQVNKKIKIFFRSKSLVRDESLIEKVGDLPFVHKVMKDNFTTLKGGVTTMYEIMISIKYEYFNGKTTDAFQGKFLKQIMELGIKTTKQFVDFTLPLIKNLSQYAHIVDDRHKRKGLRDVKHRYLKFLFNNNYVDSLSHHLSYCDDNLILFKVKDYYFHDRRALVSYMEDDFNTMDVERDIYQKKSYDENKIDKSFFDHMVLFKNINSPEQFINAEVI